MPTEDILSVLREFKAEVERGLDEYYAGPRTSPPRFALRIERGRLLCELNTCCSPGFICMAYVPEEGQSVRLHRVPRVALVSVGLALVVVPELFVHPIGKCTQFSSRKFAAWDQARKEGANAGSPTASGSS